MFKFSRKMIFTIEAVLYIAIDGARGPVQSRAVTQRQGIPERYLEQSLQRLVRVGILRGVRGPRGGYLLARPAERVSLGEIAGVVRAMEQAAEPAESGPASELGQTIVLPMFEKLDAEIMERLDRISIADLMQEAVDSDLVEDRVVRRLAATA